MQVIRVTANEPLEAESGAENRQSLGSLTKSTEASRNLLVPLVKVRFLKIF